MRSKSFSILLQDDRSWTRRRTITSLTATALAAVANAGNILPSQAALSEAGAMKAHPTPFVLVHGGWHGGWCWSRVAPILRAAGHAVWTPTLSGLAERADLLTIDTGLETHIDDVVELLDAEGLEGVVLVGHSYAGMVITGAAAARPERVTSLVYLDAFVPAAGDSLLGLLPPDRADFYRQQATERGEGWRVPPPPIAALGVTAEEDIAWLEAMLTDQPLKSFEEPLLLNAPRTMKKTYIHCTEGPIVASFAPFAERARSEPGWDYHEIATKHDAMITAPHVLSSLLLDLVPEVH